MSETPRVVPTENSNGVGILSSFVRFFDKKSGRFLDRTFSVTPTNYPIEVGDSVIVEESQLVLLELKQQVRVITHRSWLQIL